MARAKGVYTGPVESVVPGRPITAARQRRGEQVPGALPPLFEALYRRSYQEKLVSTATEPIEEEQDAMSDHTPREATDEGPTPPKADTETQHQGQGLDSDFIDGDEFNDDEQADRKLEEETLDEQIAGIAGVIIRQIDGNVPAAKSAEEGKALEAAPEGEAEPAAAGEETKAEVETEDRGTRAETLAEIEGEAVREEETETETELEIEVSAEPAGEPETEGEAAREAEAEMEAVVETEAELEAEIGAVTEAEGEEEVEAAA
jgi:pilus assembly protein FimV